MCIHPLLFKVAGMYEQRTGPREEQTERNMEPIHHTFPTSLHPLKSFDQN